MELHIGDTVAIQHFYRETTRIVMSGWKFLVISVIIDGELNILSVTHIEQSHLHSNPFASCKGLSITMTGMIVCSNIVAYSEI